MRLRDFAAKAKVQMEADYTSKRLMDAENERLRAVLFEKKKGRERKTGGSAARHMTGVEMMEALAKADWETKIGKVHNEAITQFKEI